jgi:hypothetical protein
MGFNLCRAKTGLTPTGMETPQPSAHHRRIRWPDRAGSRNAGNAPFYCAFQALSGSNRWLAGLRDSKVTGGQQCSIPSRIIPDRCTGEAKIGCTLAQSGRIRRPGRSARSVVAQRGQEIDLFFTTENWGCPGQREIFADQDTGHRTDDRQVGVTPCETMLSPTNTRTKLIVRLDIRIEPLSGWPQRCQRGWR